MILPRTQRVARELRPAVRTAEAILADLRALREADARNAYRRGALLIELSAPARLAELGVRTLAEAVEQHASMAGFTAQRYIAFAQAFDEAQAADLTLEKGQALMRYAATVLGGRSEARVLAASNAQIGRVALSEHTAASIKKLIAAWQTRRQAAHDASDDTAQKTDRSVRTLGARIRRATGAEVKLRRVRRGGGYVVRAELDPDVADLLSALLAEVLKRRKP